MIDVVIDVSSIYGVKRDGAADPSPDPGSLVTHHDDDGEGSAMNSSVFPYDQQSSSVIKLNNGMVLYLRQVNRYLALVCLMRDVCLHQLCCVPTSFALSFSPGLIMTTGSQRVIGASSNCAHVRGSPVFGATGFMARLGAFCRVVCISECLKAELTYCPTRCDPKQPSHLRAPAKRAI